MTLIERLQDPDKCMDAVDQAINRIIILERQVAEKETENTRLKAGEPWLSGATEIYGLQKRIAELETECESLKRQRWLESQGKMFITVCHYCENTATNVICVCGKHKQALSEPDDGGTI